MYATSVAVGGVYRVRYTTGVLVKAEVVGVVPPVRNHKKMETLFRCKLLERVGSSASKGTIFTVKSRSIKELLHPPVQSEAEEAVEQEPDRAHELERTTTESFHDMAVAAAERARKAQAAVDKLTGRRVKATLTIAIPVDLLGTVLSLLDEYSPAITRIE